MFKNKNHLHLFQEKSGNVTIELALLMSLFVLMILGGFDISRMAIEKHRLEQVARSAAQYGLVASGNASNSTVIASIAVEAAGDMGADITVTSRTFCGCPGQIEVDCSSPCTGGADGQLFLSVTVSKPYEFFFNFPSIMGNYTLAGTAVMPVP